jgi:ketosteroid isomerase-like protein
MSEENVEIVRRVYEGVTARLKVPRELFDPDLELDQTGVPLDTVGVSRGLEAAEESLREYWETFEDFHIDVEEVVHADEGQVVTAIRDGGRIRGSDAEVWTRFFHVWTFAGGKIARLSIHTKRSQALEAAGLEE